MNYQEINTLTIKGVKLQGDAILDFCKDSNREDIQQLGLFVKEWLNENDFIEIKTSGSTGTPKVILVEKNQMLSSAAMTATYFGFEAGQIALLCLTIQYIAGKMMVVRAMLSGLDLFCLPPSGNPLSALPAETMVDFAPLLPMQLDAATSTANIRKILLGGAPLDLQLEQKLQSFSAAVFHGYGMTETLSHVALRSVNGPERSEIYTALKGIEFEKDDRDCLVVHAPFLNGPVVTNDVVELQSPTSFLWKGRFDFVVNSGGIKLFPEEIERKIAAFIPHLFFMTGIPDERFGEQLCLCVEADPDEEEIELLREVLSTQLDKYEMPRQIFYTKNFKKTGSGKIDRQATVHQCLLRQ